MVDEIQYVGSAEQLFALLQNRSDLKGPGDLPSGVVAPYILYLCNSETYRMKERDVIKRLFKVISGKSHALDLFRFYDRGSHYFNGLNGLLKDGAKMDAAKEVLKRYDMVSELRTASKKARHYLHRDVVLHGRIYSWISPDTGAYNDEDGVAVNLCELKNKQGVVYSLDIPRTLTHEIHHIGIHCLSAVYSQAIKKLEKEELPWYALLSNLFGEGMATYATKEPLAPLTQEMFTKVDEALVTLLTRNASKRYIDRVSEELYQNNGPAYTLGRHMCAVIAREKGLPYLLELQKMGPLHFFLAYDKVGTHKFSVVHHLEHAPADLKDVVLGAEAEVDRLG